MITVLTTFLDAKGVLRHPAQTIEQGEYDNAVMQYYIANGLVKEAKKDVIEPSKKPPKDRP